MSDEPKIYPDGRKYDVGDEVDFTDDEGNVVPGVVHGVRFQQGRYELVGAQRADMHKPEGPNNPPIPGTGRMEMIKGTENERHSFEYIMVHKHEHDDWWATHKHNEAKAKDHQKKLKAAKKGEIVHHPELKEPPELRQYIRIYEQD